MTRLGPGAVFGADGFVAGRARSASAVAVEGAWLLGLLWGLALLSKYSAPLLALSTLPFLAADAAPRRADIPRVARRTVKYTSRIWHGGCKRTLTPQEGRPMATAKKKQSRSGATRRRAPK